MDIWEQANKLRQELSGALKKQDTLLKWFRIELTATSAKHVVLMKPTQRMRNLMSAAETASRDNGAIHRTMLAQSPQRGSRIDVGRINEP